MTKSSILAKDIEIYSVFCKIARRRRKILAKDIEIYGIFCQRARRRRKILGFTLFMGKFLGGLDYFLGGLETFLGGLEPVNPSMV